MGCTGAVGIKAATSESVDKRQLQAGHSVVCHQHANIALQVIGDELVLNLTVGIERRWRLPENPVPFIVIFTQA
jgi:hypothetical protein